MSTPAGNPGGARPPGQGMETFGMIGMGCAALVGAAGGLVWAAGQLAGFAAHRAWPQVPGNVAPKLALRLAQTPGDPAAA